MISQDNIIGAAFHKLCEEAKEPMGHYVSLYAKYPYYGGPEEGGWWGTDVVLESYQQFPTKEQAEQVCSKVKQLAEELSREARNRWGDYCLRQLDWLEERGLDSDYLGEPDGPTEYMVVVEQGLGSMQSRGSRHYE